MSLTEKDKQWINSTIQDRFNTMQPSPTTLKKLDAIDAKFSHIEDVVDTKVSWKQFFWIIGLLVTICMGMLGAIWYQVRANGEVAQSTRNEVSYLKGILSNADIYDTFENLSKAE